MIKEVWLSPKRKLFLSLIQKTNDIFKKKIVEKVETAWNDDFHLSIQGFEINMNLFLSVFHLLEVFKSSDSVLFWTVAVLKIEAITWVADSMS